MRATYKATRICQSSSSIIDHIYTNSSFRGQIQSIEFYEDISDHLPIYASIKCKPNKVSTQRPFRRKIKCKNMDKFVNEISASLNLPEMRCDSNLDSLITVSLHLTNIYFPKRMLSKRQFKMVKNP